MPGGRPTVYKPEHTEIAQQACTQGATNETLARRFAVPRRTIDSWIATIPAFGDAVREGRAVADLAVVSSLFARATGMEQTRTRVFCHRGRPVTATWTEHLPPDVSACMFWLRNRRPDEWRENRAIVSEEDGAAWQPGSAGIANTARRVSAQYGAKKLDQGAPAAIGTALAGIARTAEISRVRTALMRRMQTVPARLLLHALCRSAGAKRHFPVAMVPEKSIARFKRDLALVARHRDFDELT